MSDLKPVLCAITTAVGAAAAFRRDLSDLTARQSLLSQIQQEEARAEEIDKSLRELSKDARSSTGVTRQVLENDRRVAFERLKRLTAEYSRQREDPNYDLSFIQRLFLSFRPESQRAEVVRWIAFTFMAIGLISILCWIQVANPGTETEEWIADFALLGCYGTLLFRAWALEERRWNHKYKPDASVLEALFVITGPAGIAVRVAQTCFWACLFWVIESLEDFAQDISGPKGLNWGDLVKLLASLLAAALCRQWVSSELNRPAESPSPSGWLASFFRYGRGVTVVICIAELAWSIHNLASGNRIFNEEGNPEIGHGVAFIVQSLVSCVACGRWLLRLSQSAKIQAAKTQAASV